MKPLYLLFVVGLLLQPGCSQLCDVTNQRGFIIDNADLFLDLNSNPDPVCIRCFFGIGLNKMLYNDTTFYIVSTDSELSPSDPNVTFIGDGSVIINVPGAVFSSGDTVNCHSDMAEAEFGSVSGADFQYIIIIEPLVFLDPLLSSVGGVAGIVNGIVEVVEGSDLTLGCADPGNTVEPRYQWFDDSGNSLTVISNSPPLALLLTNISRDKSGEYVCRNTLSDNNEVRMTSVTVNVLYSPKILSITPENTTLNEGYTCTFNCSYDANPAPNVTWGQNMSSIDTSDPNFNIVTEETYSLLEVTFANINYSGVYGCSIDNGIPPSDVSDVVNIIVNVQDLSITPINSDGEVIALLGNDLRLTCASSSTPLSFQWTHNEVLIENAVNKILQLVGVNQSDAGTYTCSATFTDFTLSASVEVIVENGWSSESSIHVIGILPNEVISGNTHELALYITTQEKERVNFTVKTLTSTIAASSVKSGSPVNIPLAASSDVNSITDRRKGIVISTGSRKKISVVISSISGTISIATYQVFPPWGYTTDEYIYFAVSATSLNDLGTILIVAANNNTAITISPSGSSINIPADLVGNVEGATINPGESVNITLHYLQSLLLLSDDAASDLTGTKVTSNKPIAFYSGHRCANVPQSAFTCDSIGEQIPPTIAWGHEFFLSSLNDKQSLVRIIAAESSTSLNMSCTSGDYTIQLSEEGQYASQDIPTNGYQYCSIMASKPICVVQFGFSFFHNGENSGDPLMVLIPPVQQYVSQSSIPVILKTSISLYMNLLVVTKNFNASDIFMDGIPLDLLTWVPVSSQESSIQGYITNGIDFSTGSEHIISTNNNIENRLCGIVYGIGNDFSSLRGYGYLGGRNLYPYESEVIPLPTIPPTQPVPQGSDVCMNDCNSQGQRQATQYELMCCDPLNLGNFIKFQDEAHRIRYVACQSTIPDWCPDNNNLNNKPLEVF